MTAIDRLRKLCSLEEPSHEDDYEGGGVMDLVTHCSLCGKPHTVLWQRNRGWCGDAGDFGGVYPSGKPPGKRDDMPQLLCDCSARDQSPAQK